MKLASLVVALAALAVQGALAQQFGVLKDSALSKMTKQDLAMMTKNYADALDRNADGHTSGWSNAATGASGTATPISTGTEKGMTCRRVEITNSAGGMSGRGEYQACKTKGGWKFL